MSSFNEQLVALLPHMRAFALSMTRDRAFADDIAQEAATRALANRDSYRPDTNFKAWVFTILRNALYSESQRHWRHKERNDEEAMLACGSGGGQEARLEMDDFMRAFVCLPKDQREAMILIGVYGFDYDQVARITGSATGTLKSRVSRGRRDLKALLDGDALEQRRAPGDQTQRGRDTLIDPALRLAAMLKDGNDPLERGGRARTTIEASPA